MHDIKGRFETANGSKYLQQLCKHFAHKIEVSYTPEEGVCVFPMGKAYLTADQTGLTVRFELHSTEGAASARNVIDRHLERFAFREAFTSMQWD